MLQLLDDHIDDRLAIQAAEHSLGRIERTILEVLIHRRAAAAQTVILTGLAALTQSARDITAHTLEFIAVDRRRKRISIHITYGEITVVATLQAEQFRRI